MCLVLFFLLARRISAFRWRQQSHIILRSRVSPAFDWSGSNGDERPATETCHIGYNGVPPKVRKVTRPVGT
jgi:hypothetical protein